MSFIAVTTLPSTGLPDTIYKLPDNSFWFFDTSQPLPGEWFSFQSQLVSPMSFGANGDGVLDDATYLENCIDFCRDNNFIVYP
jgi:hypothetical protein